MLNIIPIVVLGVVLSVATLSSLGGVDFTFLALSCLPYLVYGLAFIKEVKKRKFAVITAGIFLLLIDTAIFIDVMFFGQSSTDPIALFTKPFFLTSLVLPVGFIVGIGLSKIFVKRTTQE